MTAKMTAVAWEFVIESWDNVDAFMVMLVSSVPYFHFIDQVHNARTQSPCQGPTGLFFNSKHALNHFLK